MKHAIGPRREMGVRTLFNLLGPLTNPAGAPNQVLGVFSAYWLNLLAQVLGRLGSRHVMVVHADDGLDEISIGAATQVAELKNGSVSCYRISPEQFGMQTGGVDTLGVADAAAADGIRIQSYGGFQNQLFIFFIEQINRADICIHVPIDHFHRLL